jgi:hypothetical protein
MIIQIMYTNNRYDYIHARKLDQLIAARHIKKFLRHSEYRWVDIARDPIRGTGEVNLWRAQEKGLTVETFVLCGITSIPTKSDRAIEINEI